jgi:hypothetical protein
MEAVPVTGRGSLEGCEMLKIPYCLDTRLTDVGEVLSLTRRPSSTLQEYFIYLSVVHISVKS